MRSILVLLFLFLGRTSYSQKTHHFGIGYSAGVSTFYSIVNNGNQQLLNNEYSFKMNQGASLKFEVNRSKRWGFYAQTGFQQRGVRFKNYLGAPKLRYSLNYWDVELGTQFLINNSPTNKFYARIGITQHTLFLSNRIYDTGKDDIHEEFSKIDLGGSIGMGYQIPVFQNQALQFQMTANSGFKQIYSKTFYQNGMRGNNLLFVAQLYYLF
ncbi:MAG: outer membrane beta-barrel protein [Crocinitomicaceae bacterium]